MSAFNVSDKHLSYLASAALLYRCGGETDGEKIVVMLRAANNESVNARYADGGMAVNETPVFRRTLDVSPVQVLKAIRCYEYQSCEHEGWTGSEAWTFCERLTATAMGKLPGYDAAAWEIS